MKKKSLIIIIIGLIILIIAFIATFFTIKNLNKEKPDYSIRSTKSNPIQEGNIRVEKIDINQEGKYVDMTVTIKNLTKKDINGFYICVELQDEQGQVVTEIAQNSKETIKAKDKCTFSGSAIVENENIIIKTAKIKELEADTVSTVERFFNEVEDTIDE